MLVIILTIAATAIAVALYFIAENKCWYYDELYATLAATLIIALVIEVGIACLQPINFRQIKAQYTVISTQMEQMEKEGIVTDAVLLKEAIEMNKTIENHKVFRADPWLSWYFSEEIANLEPLKLQ